MSDKDDAATILDDAQPAQQQEEINQLANELSTLFAGKNSAMAVLSMLSMIEAIVVHEKAESSFRRMTAELLNEQALRITDKLKPKSETRH